MTLSLVAKRVLSDLINLRIRSIRKWGNKERTFFIRNIGYQRRVGIEVEFQHSIDSNKKEKISNIFSFYIEKSALIEADWKPCSTAELGLLFCVENPELLVEAIKYGFEVLLNNDLNFLGGIHFNQQFIYNCCLSHRKQKAISNNFAILTHHDIVENKEKDNTYLKRYAIIKGDKIQEIRFSRKETKYGSPCLTPSDLISQFCLLGLAYIPEPAKSEDMMELELKKEKYFSYCDFMSQLEKERKSFSVINYRGLFK